MGFTGPAGVLSMEPLCPPIFDTILVKGLMPSAIIRHLAALSFVLDLGNRFNTATFEEEYKPVTPQSNFDSQILFQYLLNRDDRHVPGYLGESKDEVVPQGRLMIASTPPTASHDQPSISAHHPFTPYTFLPSSTLSVLNLPEASMLVTLGQGRGISVGDAKGLLDCCPHCSQFFIHRLVPEHSETCEMNCHSDKSEE
ncbi:hypothetical protein C8J57DRAFT_1238049 [Mycena rebaudengoi]|nr:hypothetical protein C8J57DRAFT_1238049 [Mycena rebaudengoi]